MFEVEKQANELFRGLGIGTSAVALAQHGINVTVIEIDPVITQFARKYFDLPQDLEVIHQDALEFLRAAVDARERYDYVVHDVFTGGAEPLRLFSDEFFPLLRHIMTPNGRIAIVTKDLSEKLQQRAD